MRRTSKRRLGPRLVEHQEPKIEWRDYDRIESVFYPAYCRSAKHYRDPGFKRWTCLLRFDVLSDDLFRVIAYVPLWLNLGEGGKPEAGRRRRYFAEWVRANGRPPRRRDRLSPQIFTKRMARVEICDTKGTVPYSKVGKILSWETGS